ncbi:MAG: hypothetical protein AAF446_01460 [Pseudomonadota bacterium]
MPADEFDLLFELGFAPNGRFASLEALEPILAAAALEFSIVVLFSGPAVSLLQGPESRRWRQLVDFDLAELVVSEWLDDGPDQLRLRLINASEAEQLRKNARTILIL